MPLAHQPSMFDVAEEAALTPLRGRARRHGLGRGAWVDHLPGWVSGSDEVLEVLLGDIGWRGDRRPMEGRGGGGPRPLRWDSGNAGAPPPPARVLRNRDAPPPSADRGAGVAEPLLRPGARRAIRQRGYVPVPGRA